jgi:SAM-dependent methyltransferase
MQFSDQHATEYQARRIACWQNLRERRETTLSKTYRRYVQRLYRVLIPEGASVLELGCGRGDLLAALKPARGVGVDFAPAMLEAAAAIHPELHFLRADAHCLNAAQAPELLGEPFDVIILSDLVNDAYDVLELLKNIRQFCKPATRLILNCHSHLWERPFQLLQRLGLVTPRLAQNWLTPDDMAELLNLAGFKLIRSFDEYLCPLPIPLLATLCNRFLAKIWPFSMFNLFHTQIARPLYEAENAPTVSVIIPARNEAGNIEAALRRTPEMGGGTEIIFVEGHSTDNTWEVIQCLCAEYAQRNVKCLRQPGKGKGDAVRAGFEAASGDILMILDADLTMPPEALPQFYTAMASGKAEFVNGVRLVYPQEEEAMRFCNLVANKFFSWAFSWLLNQAIKDTLCGTKVLSRANYRKLAAERAYFGDFDPFGDFDLIFGAAKANLDLTDLPVRYRARTYGETNISRWRDGWILLKMVCVAARRIKFVP